ncbi:MULTISPECIES: hydantoinase B/oxoprolinase family protein [unclassified Rhodococcus (in: high G+C Gram-positive bacteria)]|uniref:hydantoinase B/oxoprolinase family protein n=1 Tax=unclassified Rhodococcus (in: high G+C Gram-positive bacteria) TaxID=192944 RepID=UPI00163AB3ED|nr:MULTISPECIES: hydantoinase B/oxoprolinase family protein [unclassified Rhodococcus (in: high G+C Gram-positive bacteria)]MBC2637603.1 hydantoinase B/oxoprolinase family protein [Rhodococcus sp. 3A]MBC2644260.1 hydantoinase B/oxoprolinase family protein [Rhodococcus sp. 3A]MBC2891002.1 hydantoinase B/oxoprolinase family protein [Rhodococcus sp. 4CII]MBC2897653.1 hydantoinase B/oxoprolinase family protein [Rhodococcus sp. 4CII]
MPMPVLGSDKFISRPVDPGELNDSLKSLIPVHTVTDEQVRNIDPLTYEVVRHRLWSVTNEMGEALMRMSGSPIVTDANDFDFALSDELGQEVQVGLYNTMLVGAVDLAIYWTLQNRVVNPGIEEGDMFLCNDPWVGGGLHQNDAMVYQPIFHEGKLFAWTSAVAHQADLGGVGLGSFSPAAEDVFSEALPTPPVKVVRGNVVQEDIADMWVRRSRVPMMVGLDLRAKVGANTVGRNQLLQIIDHYGADTVKAVMKRMMNDAESRLRSKLTSVPDGKWSATGYQDQSHEGDRGVHGITVTMTKAADHLTFDFTGTDPSSGVINCTYAGLRGGIMLAVLPHLSGDIPWSTGGIMRCFDIITEEGTINNATFPAAVSRAPIGPAWLTGNLVAECLSNMLETADVTNGHVQATCCGTWDTAVIAGLDERNGASVPFLSIMMEPMAGGFGAQPHADGMDTGGLLGIPMGRVPDVEMTELMYPVLALWRREEIDSGGPGRHRGGVSASLALVPHGTSTPMGLVLASAGKAVSQNSGLSGGYPGNSGRETIIRYGGLQEMLANGQIPSTIDQLDGTTELCPCYGRTYLAPGDVFEMHWQGGGGYGDPLFREPDAVAKDVRDGYVSTDAARELYGVVLDDALAVDTNATNARRTDILSTRKSRSPQVSSYGPASPDSVTRTRRLDDNLALAETADGPGVICVHCSAVLGADHEQPLSVLTYDGKPSEAGPRIVEDTSLYVDDDVVFRQLSCPSCSAAFASSVVPTRHTDDIRWLSRALAE